MNTVREFYIAVTLTPVEWALNYGDISEEWMLQLVETVSEVVAN